MYMYLSVCVYVGVFFFCFFLGGGGYVCINKVQTNKHLSYLQAKIKQ